MSTPSRLGSARRLAGAGRGHQLGVRHMPGGCHPAVGRPFSRGLPGLRPLPHLSGRLGTPARARGEGSGSERRALGRRSRAPPRLGGSGGLRARRGVLERALADDAALARLARRRSWTAGAVSALAVGFTGIAVIGLLVVAVPAARSHRLPGYMLAVLPLVALGAFESVPPVADAVSRLSHYLAAARRVLAIAAIPTPVHDPVDPAPEPAGTDVVLKDAALRYSLDSPGLGRPHDVVPAARGSPSSGRVAPARAVS